MGRINFLKIHRKNHSLPKLPIKILVILVSIFNTGLSVTGQTSNIDAKEIIRIADERFRGLSSKGEFTMTIVRPGWSRMVTMKSWSKGTEFSMIYITSPAKEKGQVFLKRDNEMWNWIPAIERLVKIPPSMMLQSWMGSDFTNDDLLKESSIVKDYMHNLIGEEEVNGINCYKLELTPYEDAAVVWGKLVVWISKKNYNRLKTEYFDEDLYLVNVEHLTEIKMMSDRLIPTRMEMVPVDEDGNKTILVFDEIEFDIPIKESFFSQQNMKRIR